MNGRAASLALPIVDQAPQAIIAIALLVRSGAVLMARRASDKRVYPDRWDFPGGHVELGESPQEALVREVQEEIGVTVTACVPLGRIDGNEEAGGAFFYLFCVTGWTGGEPFLANDEHSALAWVALDRAGVHPDLVARGYRPVLLDLAREVVPTPR